MKRLTRRLAFSMVIIMLFGVCGNCGFNAASAAERSTKHTIWVIGDSTVSAFNDSYYYPRYGYGTQISEYINSDSYEVKNLALSGRSSKSYVLEKEYTQLLNGMSEGDFLIIGFGHNDEKAEEDRYTNPNGTYTDEGSFAHSLYENYIKKAEERGCTTILCTPIVRRTDNGQWTNSSLHITGDSGSYEGGDYPQAIIDLGSELDIPVVDMTSLTKDVYDELGAEETIYLHAWTSSKSASVDNTHTNIWGGKYNAYLIAKTIRELNVENLSDAVLDNKIEQAPVKADTLYSNPAYSEPDYDSDLNQSDLWEDAGIWKGSTFGNIGGAPDKDSFTLTAEDNDNINIAVRNKKGKITSTGDGIAMYYYKVPSKSNFTLSATATINSITPDNQVSFGLMARDDMYIDTLIPTLTSDYVAAGPMNITKTPWNCFARKSGTLTQGGTVSNTKFEAGQSIDLKIQSNSDGYACTMGDEKTITGGFDFALTSVDSEYVYVGMFSARNVDITFSNVKLIIDGKDITAGETPVEPGEEEKPVEPVDPEKPVEPSEPETPVDPEKPVEPGEEEKPSEPSNPESPDDEGKPSLEISILEKVIAEAEEEAGKVKVSKDGKDIVKTSTWVTKDILDTLNEAINDAKNVKENAVLQEEVEDAVSNLNKAFENFKAEVKYGSKKSSSSHNHSSGNSDDKDSSQVIIDDSKNENIDKNEVSKPENNVSIWYQLNGNWVIKNSDGTLKKGWHQDTDGNWYMLNKTDGSMVTGWFKDENSKWYYLNPASNGFRGAMLTGWINTNNKLYYLGNDGSMVYNAKIQGYYLGADGALAY